MEGSVNLTAKEIDEHIAAVRARIDAALSRSGRTPGDVSLIAVSKLKPCEDIEEAFHAGLRAFGENYVQELTEKRGFFEERPEYAPIEWHMIGHLQRNKVKYLVGHVALIHSVDTLALALEIEKESAKKGVVTDILLEVNVAGEENKWGFAPSEVFDAAEAVAQLSNVRLLGLMTSAPYTEDPESNRGYFRELKALADQLAAAGLIAEKEGMKTPALSMGMSGDFEVAVEEGATLVRVGTSIFGKRDYTREDTKK